MDLNSKVCNVCNQEMSKAESCINKKIEINGEFFDRDCNYFDYRERCHDCNIVNAKGNFHHLGCDVERCPKCGFQLIGCDCNDNKGGHK